jgi:Ser-tRNA(Ala) deacylase AlaX
MTHPNTTGPNRLACLCDSYLTQHDTRVAAVEHQDGARARITFDSTLFYPQGGGQPSDQGRIHGPAGQQAIVLAVSMDRLQGGDAIHECALEGNAVLAPGDPVRMALDWDLRYLHMRLHSGGHAIDHAVQLLGLPFASHKANHFPACPSVEFRLTEAAFPVDKDALHRLARDLEAKMAEIIARNPDVLVYEQALAEMPEPVRASLPEKAKALAGPVRLVLFEGSPLPVPCGGTHVAKAAEIGRITVKRIQHKDGILKISYRLQELPL